MGGVLAKIRGPGKASGGVSGRAVGGVGAA